MDKEGWDKHAPTLIVKHVCSLYTNPYKEILSLQNSKNLFPYLEFLNVTNPKLNTPDDSIFKILCFQLPPGIILVEWGVTMVERVNDSLFKVSRELMTQISLSR